MIRSQNPASIVRRAGPYRFLLFLTLVLPLLLACGPEPSPTAAFPSGQAPSPTIAQVPSAPPTQETLEPRPTATDMPASPTPLATDLPTMPTPVATRPLSTCPLGVGLRQDTIELHQTYAPAGRFIMAGSVGPAVDYFPQMEGAFRVLVAPSLQQLRELATRADEAGLVYDALGYGLERGRHTTLEEQADPLGATKQAAELADQYGKSLVLGPGLQLMQDHWSSYGPMAALVDVWILQTQRLQVDPPGPEYRQEVEKIVGELRAGNPDIEIWAQISVTPGRAAISVEEWLAYRESITDLVDGIYVMDVNDPNRPETLESIFAAVCGD